MNILTIILGVIFNLTAHDFHVSVTNAEYKEDSRSLQISMKVFIEDLEDALSDQEDNDL